MRLCSLLLVGQVFFFVRALALKFLYPRLEASVMLNLVAAAQKLPKFGARSDFQVDSFVHVHVGGRLAHGDS